MGLWMQEAGLEKSGTITLGAGVSLGLNFSKGNDSVGVPARDKFVLPSLFPDRFKM